MLAGLVFREMLSQDPQSANPGNPRVAGGGVSSSLRPKPSAFWNSVSINACQLSSGSGREELGGIAVMYSSNPSLLCLLDSHPRKEEKFGSEHHGMLSVNSPALILSKNSGVFLAKMG